MSIITLRISEKLLKETGKLAEEERLSRGAYVRKALEKMNRSVIEDRMARKLKEASRKVRKESSTVNAEFGLVEHDTED